MGNLPCSATIMHIMSSVRLTTGKLHDCRNRAIDIAMTLEDDDAVAAIGFDRVPVRRTLAAGGQAFQKKIFVSPT